MNAALEEYLARGKKYNTLDNIRALMETVKWSAQKAMDSLRIPADQQPEYLKTLEGTPTAV